MTREEAYDRIDAIIAMYEIDEEYVTITSALDYDALRMARKALEQQSCGDAISRESAINAVSNALKRTFVENEDLARKIINKIPPVTPQPKTGHWEWVQYDYNPKLGNWHCSECRSVVIECVNKNDKGGIPLYKYCPQCGAKMVEPQAESEVRNETIHT